MSELDQNLSKLTTDWEIETERDLLRKENLQLKNQISNMMQMVLELVLNEQTIIS